MSKKVTDKEFFKVVGRPVTKTNLCRQSIDDAYAACYDVIERAAELYSDLYNIEKDELIGEANLYFVEAHNRLINYKQASSSQYLHILRRGLNKHLYDYCESECTNLNYFVNINDCNLMTNEDALFYTLSDYIIKDVLSTISDKERKVLTMFFYDGYNCTQIGRKLGVTKECINNTLQKALRRLRHPARSNILRELTRQFN